MQGGKIVAVTVAPPESLVEQMLYQADNYLFLPAGNRGSSEAQPGPEFHDIVPVKHLVGICAKLWYLVSRRLADYPPGWKAIGERCAMVAVVFSRIIFLFTGVRQFVGAKSPALHGPLLLLLILSLPIQAQEKQPHILLVADPDMESPIFRHSVVLVAPQDNGSALGVILNRLIPFEPGSDYQGDELLRDAGPIHFGGPVNPALLIFLFRADSMPEGSVHLFEDVYYSSDRELLAEQLERPRKQSFLQMYAGHAGWAPGQLQAEIRHGGWSVVQANTELVFERDRDSLWDQLIRKQRDKSI